LIIQCSGCEAAVEVETEIPEVDAVLLIVQVVKPELGTELSTVADKSFFLRW